MIEKKAKAGVFLLVALLIPSLPVVAAADTVDAYDRISLSVSAAQDVANDTLAAILYAQREGNSSSRLADEVNQDVAWAVAAAKKASGIKVQTLDYHTAPVYREQVLTGWRVRQSLRLESKDAAALSALLGELQARVRLDNIAYSVSSEKQGEVQDALIVEAIADFKRRAGLVAAQWQRSGYRLLTMDVITGGNVYRPHMMSVASMDMEARRAPTLEGGTQNVQVMINGIIELRPD